jgi:hypothetical protein
MMIIRLLMWTNLSLHLLEIQSLRNFNNIRMLSQLLQILLTLSSLGANRFTLHLERSVKKCKHRKNQFTST